MYRNGSVPSPKEDASTGATSCSSNPEGGFIHRQHLARVLNLDGGGPIAGPSSSAAGGSGSLNLESKIRDCLLEQGLLSSDDAQDPILADPEDDILAELKKSQLLLKQLHHYNSATFQRFLAIAKVNNDYNIHPFKHLSSSAH